MSVEKVLRRRAATSQADEDGKPIRKRLTNGDVLKVQKIGGDSFQDIDCFQRILRLLCRSGNSNH
jgi:hypothetical protein